MLSREWKSDLNHMPIYDHEMNKAYLLVSTPPSDPLISVYKQTLITPEPNSTISA